MLEKLKLISGYSQYPRTLIPLENIGSLVEEDPHQIYYYSFDSNTADDICDQWVTPERLVDNNITTDSSNVSKTL